MWRSAVYDLRLPLQVSQDPRARTRLLLALTFIAAFGLLSAYNPWGAWDATWWNWKALYIAQGDPLLAFNAPILPHLSYPPLLPLTVGVVWRIFGVSQFASILLHGLIWTAMLAALWRLPAWAFIVAAAAMLPFSIHQTADMPLAAAVAWAWLVYRDRGDDARWGLLLSLALLLKNEGGMIALAMIGVVVIERRRIPWRGLVGLIPGVLLLALYKGFIATAPTDLFADGQAVTRLLTIERYGLIMQQVIPRVLAWGYLAIPAALVCAWADNRRPDGYALLLSAAGLAGYIAVYGLTPHDLQSHIDLSFNRLALHIFPLFMFGLASVSPVRFGRGFSHRNSVK